MRSIQKKNYLLWKTKHTNTLVPFSNAGVLRKAKVDCFPTGNNLLPNKF